MGKKKVGKGVALSLAQSCLFFLYREVALSLSVSVLPARLPDSAKLQIVSHIDFCQTTLLWLSLFNADQI